MEDRQIVTLFHQRDEAALREARRLYGGLLSALALRILGDPLDAEECVNDALLRAWNTIPPQTPVHLSAYLSKLVRGLAIDRLRARETQKRGAGEYLLSLEELSQCVGGTDAALEQQALTDAMENWLRTLSPAARWMFLRRYFAFDSIREIASEGAFTESKVKSTLARARKSLRAYLEKEGFDL